MRRPDPVPISTDECWELLATASVGRLALSVSALPAIIPVQYCVRDDELALCLGHHRVRETSLHDAVVAFSADSIVGGTGWSVQVVGRAEVRGVGALEVSCGQPGEGQMVHLSPVSISGDRLELCPFGV